jgi:hypothetical protein
MNVTPLGKARPMKNLLLNDWDGSIKRVVSFKLTKPGN